MRRFARAVVALVGVVLMAARSFNPVSQFLGRPSQMSADRMAEIVDAVNSQDAAALKAMFTAFALAEYADEIDEGLSYLPVTPAMPPSFPARADRRDRVGP